MKFIDHMLKIDRRIIYLILAIVIIIPMLMRMPLRIRVMHPVASLFHAIDTIPQNKALIINFEFDPRDLPELEPMGLAVLRHAFKKRIKVLVLSLYVQPLGLAKAALDQVTNEFNSTAATNQDSIIYGRDYVFLGWQPPPLLPIINMGESISGVYKKDYYGNETDTLPLMKHIVNYKDVGLLVSLSSSDVPKWWLEFAQNRFGLKVGAGVTSVSASEFYQFLQTGQFSGLMVGMKGAAEYEEMVESNLNIYKKRKATESMSSITYAHLVMILFILIGNIGYFIKRRQK